MKDGIIEKVTIKLSENPRELLSILSDEYCSQRPIIQEYLKNPSGLKHSPTDQLYYTILGLVRLYDLYSKLDVATEKSEVLFIHFTNQWVNAKAAQFSQPYGLFLAPESLSIIELVKKAISGKYKFAGYFDNKCRAKYRMVARAQILRIMKSQTKLVKQLSEDGDKEKAANKAKEIISSLAEDGILIEKEIKIGNSRKLCIGLGASPPPNGREGI